MGDNLRNKVLVLHMNTPYNKVVISDVKNVLHINECRYDEDNYPMFDNDELVIRCKNKIFEVADYDSSDNTIAIYIGGIKVWLYRNEYLVLIKNLFVED